MDLEKTDSEEHSAPESATESAAESTPESALASEGDDTPEIPAEVVEFLNDDEDDLTEEAGEPDTTPAEATEKAPESKESTRESAEVSPAPEPEPPAQAEQAPAEPAEPQVEEDQTRLREEAVELLATQHYRLSEEEVEKLEVEPETAIPRMMAKVYLDAVGQAVQRVAEAFPVLLDQAMQAREQRAGLEEKFFQAWPQLDREKHAADIQRFGQIYRQLNPKASAEEFIRDVGAQVLVAHRIPLEPAPAAKEETPKPYAPAISAPTSGAPQNVFEQLDSLFEQDLTDF